MCGKFKYNPLPAGDGGTSNIEPVESVTIFSTIEADTSVKAPDTLASTVLRLVANEAEASVKAPDTDELTDARPVSISD